MSDSFSSRPDTQDAIKDNSWLKLPNKKNVAEPLPFQSFSNSESFSKIECELNSKTNQWNWKHSPKSESTSRICLFLYSAEDIFESKIKKIRNNPSKIRLNYLLCLLVNCKEMNLMVESQDLNWCWGSLARFFYSWVLSPEGKVIFHSDHSVPILTKLSLVIFRIWLRDFCLNWKYFIVNWNRILI